MNRVREPPKKRGYQVHIASCSFGKDSIATIIIAHEHNEPLDEIVYCEVMFDKDISGELPEHRNFIYNKAIPTFESWGYKVTVLRSDKTYMDCFYHKRIKGKNIGRNVGFVFSGRCDVQRDCKIKTIKEYWKSQSKEVAQYIGIAIDEPKRLDRIADTKNKVSLLEKYGYTEEMARQKCVDYDLLSPIYQFANRGGCWFCPNQSKKELKHLRKHHRELWDKLLEMSKQDVVNPYFNAFRKITIQELERMFELEDQQITIFDYMKGQENTEK